MGYLTMHTPDATTRVFTALADPTRRRIVELLAADGPLRVLDMARQLPVTRQAVAKHLDVLAEAGITASEWRGRERLTVLVNGAFDPVQDWLKRYDRFWETKLDALKGRIEGRDEP